MAWTKIELLNGTRGVVAYSEEALNNSDKEFKAEDRLATGGVFHVLSIVMEYAATATVGTRTVLLSLEDSADADILWSGRAADIIADGNLTHEWAYGSAGIESAVGPTREALPKILLATGFSLRVKDTAAIAAAADDMVIHIYGELMPR